MSEVDELRNLEEKSFKFGGLSDPEDLAKLFSDLGEAELKEALEVAKEEALTEVNQSPPVSQTREKEEEISETQKLGENEAAVSQVRETKETKETKEISPKPEEEKKEEGRKTYEELMEAFAKQKEELEELRKLVLLQSNLPYGMQEQKGEQKDQKTEFRFPEIDEIKDTDILDNPKETLLKIIPKVADAIAAKRVLEYHDWLTRQTAVETFRATHPDFDELRNDMIAIAQANPQLNKMHPAQGLPILYEMAKAKRRLNKSETSQATSQVSPMSQANQVQERPREIKETKDVKEARSDAELLSNLKKEILRELIGEIKKRKEASAASSAMRESVATNPQERLEGPPQESPEEEIFRRILNAGPKALELRPAKSK